MADSKMHATCILKQIVGRNWRTRRRSRSRQLSCGFTQRHQELGQHSVGQRPDRVRIPSIPRWSVPRRLCRWDDGFESELTD